MTDSLTTTAPADMLGALTFDAHQVETVTLPEGDVNLVPVFVYGSLRPDANGANGIMEGGKVAGPWPAYMKASLHYHECGAYPVLDVNDTTGIVRGDVYLMDVDSRSWEWVLGMELNAGYEVDWCTAYIAQDGTMRKAEVVTFGWHVPYRGARIDNGDWLTADWAQWPERNR